MNLKSLLPLILLTLGNSEALEFSQPEWNNPSQGGDSVRLSNKKSKPVTIEAIYVRDKGFKISDEVALTVGSTRYYFMAEKTKRAEWMRLKTKDKRKIRLKAKESLAVRGFEYGSKLKAKPPAKMLSDEYVLDLKLVEKGGDSSIVKVSESSTKYYINGTADGGSASQE
ncbi:MAG: hypothetical protein ABI036_21155 [Fibrobacteria bacterium]